MSVITESAMIEQMKELIDKELAKDDLCALYNHLFPGDIDESCVIWDLTDGKKEPG